MFEFVPFSYSLDLRQKAVEAYKNGSGTVAEVAKTFGIGKRTLENYLRRDRQGNLERAAYPGQKSSVTEEHRDYITNRILKEPSIRLLQLCAELESKFNVSITEGWMCVLVKKLGFKRKKKSYLPSEQLDETLKKNG